jgi:hypothetical protein
MINNGSKHSVSEFLKTEQLVGYYRSAIYERYGDG